MSLEKLTGARTLGGHFRWETTYEENDWKIQHHKTKKAGSKSYRLLNPDNRLMASSDTEEETKEYLNELIHH
jgi:hypothetical protein